MTIEEHLQAVRAELVRSHEADIADWIDLAEKAKAEGDLRRYESRMSIATVLRATPYPWEKKYRKPVGAKG